MYVKHDQCERYGNKKAKKMRVRNSKEINKLNGGEREREREMETFLNTDKEVFEATSMRMCLCERERERGR